jgi:transcriptional regulator with XRE-family HTH domain
MAHTLTTIRNKLREAAEASGMTQQQIGEAMGFTASGARQAVSRLLNPEVDYDPRLSTLVAFAAAIKRPLADLL